MEPVRGMSEVLDVLKCNPISKMSWLSLPNAIFGNQRPIDALRRGEMETVLQKRNPFKWCRHGSDSATTSGFETRADISSNKHNIPNIAALLSNEIWSGCEFFMNLLDI